MTRSSESVFLTAEWRNLVMLNYAIDPDLLSRLVPAGTVLDSFAGKTYISLIGFRFLRTRLLSFLPVPFHTDFSEVNLRFYVRRHMGGEGRKDENRRGVVFIAEIVPRRAIAAVARSLYGENYRFAPIKHQITEKPESASIEFEWRSGRERCRISAQTQSAPSLPVAGSVEEFITEHYWGYSSQSNSRTLEYRVEHPRWQVLHADGRFEGDPGDLYGSELNAILRRNPDSAFVAQGSPVVVFRGECIQ
jgi:uncharacterized protein YqjF (DUF2071 family)